MAFLAEGYGSLVERARKLSERPDLAAAVRETLDGLLAYDLGCRDGDTAAREFAALLETHAKTRHGLEEEAEEAGHAVAGLADYADWRARSARLAENGEALFSDLGARAGDAGDEIRNALARLPAQHALDDAHHALETLGDEVAASAKAAGTIAFYAEGHDALLDSPRKLAGMANLPAHAREAAGEVIAEAKACDTRRAAVGALRAEAAELLAEREAMEAGMAGVPVHRLEPPTRRADYAGWAERAEKAEERWKAMEAAAGTWDAHLDRLGEGRAALEAGVESLGALRSHDGAWAELHAMRGGILERANAETVAAFDLPEWDAFARKATELAGREGLPAAAARAAAAVLEYDRRCRAVDGFLAGAEAHGARWDALRARAGLREDVSIIDLRDYAPLTKDEHALRETGETILAEDAGYRHPDVLAAFGPESGRRGPAPNAWPNPYWKPPALPADELTRTLWGVASTLMQTARLNLIGADEPRRPPGEWLTEIAKAAERLYLPPRAPASGFLFTDPAAWRSGEVAAKLEAVAPGWPEGGRPGGFLCWRWRRWTGIRSPRAGRAMSRRSPKWPVRGSPAGSPWRGPGCSSAPLLARGTSGRAWRPARGRSPRSTAPSRSIRTTSTRRPARSGGWSGRWPATRISAPCSAEPSGSGSRSRSRSSGPPSAIARRTSC